MESIKLRLMKWLIGMAGSRELSEIVRAVLGRYGELFAEEEVIFLSLPKGDFQERKRIIDAVLSLEENRE